MKLFSALKSLVFLIFISLVFSACSTGKETFSSNEIRAGLAETDITPPVGYRMAGYFDERLSTGIHDPLHAKAIVLEQNGQTIAMVFCDIVGISLSVSKPARTQASNKTGIPVANIFIAATHSHTGPLFGDVRRDAFHAEAIKEFGHDPQEKIYYPDFLTKKLVEVIVAAKSKMKPAEIDVGIGRQENLAFNRRYHMKNGTVAFNPGQLNPNTIGPAGPTDPDVGMLLVRDSNQKLRGGLTVFAMHADTAGGTLFSADYPYFLEQTLREKLGENYISAFAAGTCGDINHINVGVKESVKGFDVTERLGSTLGKTVLANLSGAQPLVHPDFAVESKIIIAPLQEVSPEKLADAKSKIAQLGDENVNFYTKVEAVKSLDLAEKGTNWAMEVQVFRLDKDTAIVALPCEIFVELGLAIKAQSPFQKTLVISICNDRPSYVPTKRAFKEGSYEVTNARVKPGVGEMLVDTAVELLKKIKPEQK